MCQVVRRVRPERRRDPAIGLDVLDEPKSRDIVEDEPMKYVILIYDNPASRKEWMALPPERRAEGLAVYAALHEDLVGSGELIVSEALADTSLTKRVRVSDGQTLITDGPFAEVKEFLAGFFLVECASAERAMEIAARVPEASFGVVEVRPVMELSGFEM
jgi:hypothetical protein